MKNAERILVVNMVAFSHYANNRKLQEDGVINLKMEVHNLKL